MNTRQTMCSFCKSQPAIAMHEVDLHYVEMEPGAMQGWWNACEDCHRLIMADDVATLNGRVASLNPAYKDLDLIDACNAAAAFTDTFWSLQTRVYETLPF